LHREQLQLDKVAPLSSCQLQLYQVAITHGRLDRAVGSYHMNCAFYYFDTRQL
jgi:hypothetical protein